MKKTVLVLMFLFLVSGLYAGEETAQIEQEKAEGKIRQVELRVKNRKRIKGKIAVRHEEYRVDREVEDSVKQKAKEEILKKIRMNEIKGKGIKELKKFKEQNNNLELKNFYASITRKSPLEKYFVGMSGGGYKGKRYDKYLILDKRGRLVNLIDGGISNQGEWSESLEVPYVSDKGGFVYQQENGFGFYGRKTELIKEVYLDSTNGYGYPIKGEDKILICGGDMFKDKGVIELRTFSGDLIWKKETDGRIYEQRFVFSKNMKYFAFEVNREDESPKIWVMEINGNKLNEFDFWGKELAISNSGKYLVAKYTMYDLETADKIKTFNIEDLMRDLWHEKWYYSEEEIREMYKEIYEGRSDEIMERKYNKFISELKDPNYRGAMHLDLKGKSIKIFGKGFDGKMEFVDISEDSEYMLFVINGRGGHIIITDLEGKDMRRYDFNESLKRAVFADKDRGIKVVTEDEIIEVDIK